MIFIQNIYCHPTSDIVHIFRNVLQLLIILVLISYIIYGKVIREDPVSSQFNFSSEPQERDTYKRNIYTYDVPAAIFAGETVPLDDIEVKERLDRELHVNTYWHSSTVFNIKRAARWLPQIAEVLKENGLPEDFKYLAIIESGLMNVKSPRGATGFWQIMEATGRELGLEINDEVDERYHPTKSTVAASKFLLKAYERFGSYTSAAASYNMGMMGLYRNMQQQKASNYYDLLLNEETSRYIFRVLALKEIMENQAKYGYIIPEKHLYQAEPVEYVTVEATIPDLVQFAIDHDVTYKVLKQYNPWLRKNTLTIKKSGKIYEISLPIKHPFYSPYLEDTIRIEKDSLKMEGEQ